MSDRIHIGTRKGLVTVVRTNGMWAVGGCDFLGDPVTMTLDDHRDGALYAALNLGHFGSKLRKSTDGGSTWNDIAIPTYPPQPVDGEYNPNPSTPWKLEQIWELTTGGADEPGRLWCGTIPGGLFTSTDGGESWDIVRSLWDRPEREHWFGGGYDHAGIHSVLVDPRDSAVLHVGISCGGHWVSHDRGETWECHTKGMFAEYMPPDRREDPAIQDPHIIVQCPSNPDAIWCQHHNGVFRSIDAGKNWTHVDAIKPSGFGFACAVHPNDPDTAWFVPGVKDECRVPVDLEFVVARTRDGGRSFDVLRGGLPQQNSFDLVFRHALAIDSTGELLAMGSTTGSFWVSESGGDTWELVSSNLAPVYSVRFTDG